MNPFKFKHLTIRVKLISYFVAMTLVFAAISGLSYYISSNQSRQVSGIVVDYVFLSDLSDAVVNLDHEVENYLINRSSESLLNYYTILDDLNQRNKKLSRKRSFDNSEMLIRGISYTLSEYISQADRAIEGKRGRNTEAYTQAYERMGELEAYLNQDIDELLAAKLKEGSKAYDAAMSKTEAINWFSFFLIAGSLFMGFGLAGYMTLAITRPLTKLTESAERVATGDFEVEPLTIKSNDEIEILSEAFNEMLSNIKTHIDDLTLQSELENNLKEQLMQNLAMKNLLKEAELKSLQAQINPHFLYNTLNAASQLAMIEGADHTSELIQKVAMYFRYMLKKLGSNVTIREEIENVETYMYILKTRFGERISYESFIEAGLLDCLIPSTILQPVVENAYLHGLEGFEEKGFISLSLKSEAGKIRIDIQDNGIGMDQETLEKILSFGETSQGDVNTSSGIGMKNIVERIRHFSGELRQDEVINIYSRPGEGTRITLWLPMIKENS